MPLTDIQVRNAKATDKPRKIFDVDGLFLLVSPTKKVGRGKSWRFKYHIGGKEKLLALGTYPEISLSEARSLRDEARRQVAKGVDPGELKKQLVKEADWQQNNTFEKLAREWHGK